MLIKENQPPGCDKLVMSLSAYGIQGKRNHMEDFFDIGYQMKPLEQRCEGQWPYEYFYFAIFDGHGGEDAAKFAKQNLLKSITSLKDFWSNNDDDVLRAIKKGFANCHLEMKSAMPSWARTSKILPSTAGTTASILFIRDGKFYTGHVGDSRIVISKENPTTQRWIPEQLTEDHKPESEREIRRIQRAGGEVKEKTGVQRVVWRRPVLTKTLEMNLTNPHSIEYKDTLNLISNYPIDESMINYYQVIPFLAIARSLGDFWSINPYSGQYIVSPEPDVSCRAITHDDKCILLASDGLWNVMDAMKAVRFLQELEIIKNGEKDRYKDEHFITDNYYNLTGVDGNYSRSLVYIAFQIWERKRLRSDNITVVTAMLHDILAKSRQSKCGYSIRSSVSHREKTKLKCDEIINEAVQIEHTNYFVENITHDKEPSLYSECQSRMNDPSFREKLELHLVLPPTMLKDSFNITNPRNYELLSNATCRLIDRRDKNHDQYISIKNVSDDPADQYENPAYIGKSGKEVRDSSAQVSDWMHDFNQPWNELKADKTSDLYENIIDTSNDDDVSKDTIDKIRSLLNSDDDKSIDDFPIDEDEDFVEYSDDADEVDETVSELLDEINVSKRMEEQQVDSDLKVTSILEASKFGKRESSKTSIPQLRCLLNYTPVLRRSKRSKTYVSLSENTKRKNFNAPTASITKTKRRKSQPIRCNASRI